MMQHSFRYKQLHSLLFTLCLLFGASSVSAAGKLDVNKASAKQMASQLLGVGEVKAAAIVAYRDNHGPFRSTDDLLKVPGVGPKTVARNLDRISLPQGKSPLPTLAKPAASSP